MTGSTRSPISDVRPCRSRCWSSSCPARTSSKLVRASKSWVWIEEESCIPRYRQHQCAPTILDHPRDGGFGPVPSDPVGVLVGAAGDAGLVLGVGQRLGQKPPHV